MKSLFYLLITTLVISSTCTYATEIVSNKLWNDANNFYSKKEYDSAINLYTKVIKQQPHNAVAYFNLGNAYYKKNMNTEAIIAYERATWHQANYTNALNNLKLAQSRILNPIPSSNDIFFIRWWVYITQASLSNIWAFIGLGLFIVFWYIYYTNNIAEKKVLYASQLELLLTLFIVICLFISYKGAYNGSYSNKAVVSNINTSMLQKPNNFKDQKPIPAGTTVTLKDVNNDWVLVDLPNGNEGWILKSNLTFITPNFNK